MFHFSKPACISASLMSLNVVSLIERMHLMNVGASGNTADGTSWLLSFGGGAGTAIALQLGSCLKSTGATTSALNTELAAGISHGILNAAHFTLDKKS